jgi:hypothetical protein
MSFGPNDAKTKLHFDEMSLRQNVEETKCHQHKMLARHFKILPHSQTIGGKNVV